MQIAFGVILVSGICGGFFGKYCTLALPAALHHVISRDLDEVADQMYDSYLEFASDDRGADREVDVVSQVEHTFSPVNDGGEMAIDSQKPMAYLLFKRMRQRDKRYISYLTLCHFKICNMGGRKRTTRYFQMIRSMDDNEA